jgi:hypothetical protein
MVGMAELRNVAGCALFCHYTIRLKVGGLLVKSSSEEQHTFAFNQYKKHLEGSCTLWILWIPSKTLLTYFEQHQNSAVTLGWRPKAAILFNVHHKISCGNDSLFSSITTSFWTSLYLPLLLDTDTRSNWPLMWSQLHTSVHDTVKNRPN